MSALAFPQIGRSPLALDSAVRTWRRLRLRRVGRRGAPKRSPQDSDSLEAARWILRTQQSMAEEFEIQFGKQVGKGKMQ